MDFTRFNRIFRFSKYQWFELLGHYIIHKLDIFDITDRDDVADMESYKYDNNAYIWEKIIHGIMKGLGNWYYDYW